MKRKVEFLLSAAHPDHFPQAGLPEVAFLGRSNVGKSSLINALVGQAGVAKTSSTPGRTRLLNFFRVEDRFHLVDMPGYGYAKVPKDMSAAWGQLIESYLRERETLRLCVILLDARRGWMKTDLELKEWLAFHNRPFVVAATKVDKLNQKEEHHGLGAIRRELGAAPTAAPSLPPDHPQRMAPAMEAPAPVHREMIPVSAHTGRGMRELWQTIWKTTQS